MSATVERIQSITVATSAEADRVLLAMDGLKEDVKIIADLPRLQAQKLALDLIAAGFGPDK
jgi:hypothetical protein